MMALPTLRGMHPDSETLSRFIQGRLGDLEMSRVEQHIAKCDSCCRKLEREPDDRLMRILRTEPRRKT